MASSRTLLPYARACADDDPCNCEKWSGKYRRCLQLSSSLFSFTMESANQSARNCLVVMKNEINGKKWFVPALDCFRARVELKWDKGLRNQILKLNMVTSYSLCRCRSGVWRCLVPWIGRIQEKQQNSLATTYFTKLRKATLGGLLTKKCNFFFHGNMHSRVTHRALWLSLG